MNAVVTFNLFLPAVRRKCRWWSCETRWLAVPT